MDPLGLACAAVAVLAFGSNFIVTKAYPTGDGLFFQWIMCISVLMSGIVHWVVLCSITEDAAGNKGVCPSFQPFAMLGGVIWCFGNILVVPIVKCIGLGLGIAIWGSVNLLGGWAVGKFGLFGLPADPISSPLLNYVGVVISTIAVVIFLFIKPDLKTVPYKALDEDGEDTTEAGSIRVGLIGKAAAADEDETTAVAGDAGGDGMGASWVDALPAPVKRITGVLMACVSGVCYSQNFTPPSYVAKHPEKFPGASSDLSTYVLPHFLGIAMTSTAFLLIYCALKRNQPVLFPTIVLPGFLSGTVWSIAQISWFIANGRLSLSIAFPLIAAGPGVVGALWGAIVYKEITGRRNLVLLAVAFACVVASAVFISLSK